MAIILHGAQLFDGGIRGRIPNATVVIDGERIATVHTDGPAPPAQQDTVYDLRGKTVLPGLFNCHAHLGWDGYGDLKDESIEAAQQPVHAGVRVARNMRASLEGGVTTMRDLGVHHTALAGRDMARRGLVAGPRIIAAGSAIACTGGHTWWCLREADGPHEVRRAVREQARAGAEWIKVMASGHQEKEYTDEELRAAAEEAHQLGLKITAHATFSPSAQACVQAGFDGIEHGGNYNADVEDQIVKGGVWITPTFSPLLLQARHGLDWGMRREDVETRRRTLANPVRLQGVARLRRKGAKLAFGTDAGSPVVPHNDVASEMEGLMEFGVYDSAEEVLTVATRRSAEMLGLDKQLGTVEPGKLADLVVVNGDPLNNVADVRKVEKVFLGGRLVVDGGSVVRGL